jgi:hypothetical protein
MLEAKDNLHSAQNKIDVYIGSRILVAQENPPRDRFAPLSHTAQKLCCMLRNQGSTARDFLAFERNFLSQVRTVYFLTSVTPSAPRSPQHVCIGSFWRLALLALLVLPASCADTDTTGFGEWSLDS